MARKARFTNALPVYVTPAVRADLDGIADDYEVSLARVTRVLIDKGRATITDDELKAAFADD